MDDLSAEAQTENCSVALGGEAEDTITTQYMTQKNELIRSSKQGFCTRLTNPEHAQGILREMKKLAAKYYPLPFPKDACGDAVDKLDSLYAEVNTCSTDTDCYYFDKNFEPIERSTFTFLAINDCSPVKSLQVANKNLVVKRQSELVHLFSSTSRTCLNANLSPNCNGFAPFQPTLPTPVCVVGKCKATGPSTLQ
jgi:hypothetical protein